MSKEILIQSPVSRALLASNPIERREGSCFPFGTAALSLFSVPFVLKTHPNVGDPVAQLRFSRMNLNLRTETMKNVERFYPGTARIDPQSGKEPSAVSNEP